eukprot:maker-scaffold287_size221780-snap-gene-1.25 protein:Tk01900 transcript:maker-scaffold287_size221780-snap-gene-1.25-mRNA-1 annotation:"hypothetical protein CAPTEDRAFT_224905"
MSQTPGKFLYFAFGSNLLTKRIHIQNPSAIAVGRALLKDYELDFRLPSKRWHGCAATIIPSPGQRVWGVLWELKNEDLASLDNQEGVALNLYERIQVKVKLNGTGEDITPFTYKVREEMMTSKSEDRRPSKVYKGVILAGAEENKLPEDYCDELKAIVDNGYDGPVEVKLA